jgi:hypothetical protein
MTDEARPEVARALRAAAGRAELVAGDRCYAVPPDALRDEIRAFLDALADAVASHASGEPSRAAPLPGPGSVVAVPWLERALEMEGLSVQSWRARDGARYAAKVALEPRRAVFADVRGAPAVDAAWDRLAAAARAQAVFVEWWPPLGPRLDRFDMRRTGPPG